MSRYSKGFCRTAILLVLVVLTPNLTAQGTITTAAGTDWVFNGDGKAALAAPLGKLGFVTVDSAGRPVFSDPGSAVVLRLNSDGTLTVLAGNGIQSYSGDGGLAVNAALRYPQGVAYDSRGNLFIVDKGNARIRMLTRDGIITTVAGNGTVGYTGDRGSAITASFNDPVAVAIDSANNVYVSDLGNAAIRKITPEGIISTLVGPATGAALNDVEGMAFDSAGNLYLAEFGNNLIRRIDSKGNIAVFAGDGQGRFLGDGGPAAKASFYSPGGVAVDAAGSVYVADTNNFCIRKIEQGIVSTIAGTRTPGFSGDGGPALGAAFRSVFGLAVDPAGNLYVADRDNFRIRKVSTTRIVTTVAGNGEFRKFADGTSPSRAFLFWPFGVSFDLAGNLYVADTLNDRIRMIGRSGGISTVAGNGGGEQSGDGELAVAAGLFSPTSTTPDSLGNVYIADNDNNVVRKIAPNGIITTVAGNHKGGYSGDNGIATAASLNSPRQVALDAGGNLYIADLFNHRVRRVGTNGIITTYAGGNQPGFAGDGHPAAQSLLNRPTALTFDNAGNLYIADSLNARIRRISPDGLITTFAGGGTRIPTSTDSVPATEAQLGVPLGITIDRSNNLFFSDVRTNRILKITTAGLISVVAGNGIAGFSGDGGPSLQASLRYPYGLAVDAAGNLWIADALNDRIRKVLVAPPAFDVSPLALSFSVKGGGGLSDAQPIAISCSVPGLLYSLTTRAPWLKADQAGGSTPGVAQVRVDPASLEPGEYQATIELSAANANPPSRLVSVHLTVLAAEAAKLGITAQALTYSFVQGAARSSQSLTVSNLGGGSLAFSVSASTETGGEWLTLSASQGQATPAQPASIGVQADPGALDPGTYTGSIRVTTGSAGSAVIPVTMTVSPVPRRLLLSQSGLKFTAVARGGAPLPQSFAVLNAGKGDLNWTLQADTVPSGGDWLIAPTMTGTSKADLTSVPLVTLAVDAGNLEPGSYYAKVQIFSPDADNSPQTVTVLLDVLPPGSDPGPDVQPSGLVFTGTAGSSPGSQTLFVSNLSSQPITYSSARSTQAAQPWFVNAPTDGDVLPGQPARILVQPDFTRLTPGTYNSTLQLTFSDGVTRPINILSIVGESANSSSSGVLYEGLRPAIAPQASTCKPNQLNVQFTSPERSFTHTASQPLRVQIALLDNCNNPINEASVKARFSNGDPDMPLWPKGGGVWENSWQPNIATNQLTMVVSAFAEISFNRIAGEMTISGSVRPGGSTPMVSSGVLNAASYVAKPLVAPGALITIFGQQLADQCDSVPGPPFVNQLGGTQVFLDDNPLALLYACDTQINAQVPYNLTVNTPHQILVQRTAKLSVPVDLSVAATQPAVFTVNQQGTGQGNILLLAADGNESTTADSNTPAAAGDSIAIYCTGLGTVSPTVDLGAPAPVAPVSRTTNPVLVTIGGKQATVFSAALTPNKAGVYTVKAVVPAGVTAGDQVEVVVTAGRQSSPPVTMAVK